MIIDLLKKAGKLLPTNVQNQLQLKKNRFNRYKMINAWEKAGKPVPPPHEIKQITIESYQQRYHCNTLVETGTYTGKMVLMQKDNFPKIYSIEISPELWQSAVKKFASYSHIEILQGDSGKVLYDLVPKIQSSAIFWLDGHYSAGITAKGEKNCPIYEEFDAILSNKDMDHIVLIDDARHFIGKNDYPTLQELNDYVSAKNPSYQMEVNDDIIRFTKEN
ncbi:MAG: hypothetical protein RIG62_32645 [Cyclobacteriaceae bacterium]